MADINISELPPINSATNDDVFIINDADTVTSKITWEKLKESIDRFYGQVVFDQGTASNPSITFVGDENTGIFSPSIDQLGFSTNGTTRIFIDEAGKVAIGANDPGDYSTISNDLVVGSENTGDNGLTILTGSADLGTLSFADGTLSTEATAGQIIYDHSNDTMRFETASSERIRIDSFGNVGIGTDDPQSLLHISSGDSGVDNLVPGVFGFIVEALSTQNAGIQFLTGDNRTAGLYFIDPDDIYAGYAVFDNTGETLDFGINNVDRLKIANTGVVINKADGVQAMTVTDTGLFRVGPGTPTNELLSITANAGGAPDFIAIGTSGIIESSVTSSFTGFSANVSTAAGSFTIPDAYHFRSEGGSVGAGSAITNQYAFYAADLTNAANNFGFYANMSSLGDYQFYSAGSSPNYFRSDLHEFVNGNTVALTISGGDVIIEDSFLTKAQVTNLTATNANIATLSSTTVNVTDSLSAPSANITGLVSELLTATNLTADTITNTTFNGTNGDFAGTLTVGTITAAVGNFNSSLYAPNSTLTTAGISTANIGTLNLTGGTATNFNVTNVLTATNIDVDDVDVDDFTAFNANVTGTLTAPDINGTRIDAGTIAATNGNFTNGTISSANITTLTSPTSNITTANITNANVNGTLTAPDINGTVGDFTGSITTPVGNITNVNTTTATVTTVDAVNIDVDDLDATAANINNLTAETLSTPNLTATNASVTGTLTAADFNGTQIDATTVVATNVNGTTLTSPTGNITTVNSTTVNSTDVNAVDVTVTGSLTIPGGITGSVQGDSMTVNDLTVNDDGLIGGNLSVTGLSSTGDGRVTAAGGFYGTLYGNAQNATNASHASTADHLRTDRRDGTNASHYLTFVISSSTGSNQRQYVDSGLVYNPASNTITASTFSGSLAGNATTATSATSATNASLLNIATNGTNNNYNVYFGSSSGMQQIYSDSGLLYNPATNTLTASTFSGTLSGNASSATNAVNADKIDVSATNSTNANYAVIFASTSPNTDLRSDTSLYYNPSSNTLTASTFSGNLSGNASTATNANNATLATTATTATNVNALSTSTNASYRVYFGSASSSTRVRYDDAIVYNPATNVLTVPTFNGSLTGNATSATALQTGRNINGIFFNGTSNITVEPYIERDDGSSANRPITFVDNTTAGYKRINMDTGLTYNPSSNAITASTFVGALSGNASTATHAGRWTTARTITLAGDASGSVSIDGSQNRTLTVAVANDSHNHSSSSGSFNVNGYLLASSGARAPYYVWGTGDVTGANVDHIWHDDVDDRYHFVSDGTVNSTGNSTLVAGGAIIGGSNVLTAATSFGGDVSGTYNNIVIRDDSHNHQIDNVDGLQAALDAKLDNNGAYVSTTTQFGGDVSGTYNTIVVKDDSHNHVISNVDGLQAALDAKLNSSDTITQAVNANNIQVDADNGSNITHYITFTGDQTGNQRLNSDSGLVYNPATNTITASTFSGSLSGNASSATNATNSTYSTFSANTRVDQDNSSNSTRYLTFVGGSNNTGIRMNMDLSLTYNPGTNILSVNGLSGAGNIGASGSPYSTVYATSFVGSSLSLSGSAALSGGITLGSGLTVNAGTVDINGSGSINANSRTLTVQDLTVTGTLTSSNNGSGSISADIIDANALKLGENDYVSWGASEEFKVFLYDRVVYNDFDGDINFWKIRSNSNADLLTCSATGDLVATGNITAFSDERIKTDIEVIESAVDKVKQLRGITYNRTDVEGPRQVGLIAQEVQKVLPEAVSETESGILTVAYGNLSGLLVEAIKEQQELIEALRKEVEELKGAN